jgi:DNA-binding SARP family transcriptional activator
MLSGVLRLITLGGLALTRDGAPYAGAAAQRRRLAIMAVLATAGPAGVTRDKLLAYFWPDSGEDQARHALNQALHQIRQALGADAIASGSMSLALNVGVVSSDVAEFDQASADRALERAAAVYQGPFLDGFFLSDAPDFERWVTATRARLGRTWASIVDSLASAASARRDRAAVVRWRQQLANADPLNANSIIALVEAHVANGDRAAALRAVTAHDTLVRTELDSEPDQEIQHWITRLKSAPRVEAAARSDVSREPVTAESRLRTRIDQASGGRYAVDRVLSKGAVLTTLAVTDTRDHTVAALHVVSTQAMGHADPERFCDTMRRVATVGDPRIVPVLDVLATDEITYFVTPPQTGPTLRERLVRDRQLAIPDSIRLARDLAATLAVAHAHAVTHGDLRPKHIGLLSDGVIVGGWLLVEALAPIGDVGGSSAIETAVTIAAPAYASPEQLEGGRLPDARSDVYSLGCVLFETLAGMPPFAPSGGHAILARKLTEPAPSVRDARESVPAEIDAILRTCLARSPADRYASGAALADALAAIPE